MGCGHDDRHGGLAERHTPCAVPQHDAADVGHESPGGACELSESRQDHVLVGLVVDCDHAGAPFSMIPDDPEETHHAPEPLAPNPRERTAGIEEVPGEDEPVVPVWWIEGNRRGHHLLHGTQQSGPSSHASASPGPRPRASPRFVSSWAVAGASSEFDDVFDDDESGPLLPPEDRVWRHPSELSASGMAAEASAAREHWLTSTPTRAGAWSAGLVGAVLATGVVLVGTHLTSWLGAASARPAVTTAAVTTTLAPAAASCVLTPFAYDLCSRVHASLTVVEVNTPHGKVVGDGVVLTAGGKILVPLSLVAGASLIQVTTDDGDVFAGRLVGTDSATGLAVVSVGSDWLRPLASASNSIVTPGQWLAVEWSFGPAGESQLSMGAASSPSAAATGPGSFELLDGLHLQALELGSSPVGAVLLNAKGQLLGMIIRRNGDAVVETPGNLAVRVGDQIARYGRVVHGWLGIDGESIYSVAPDPPPTSRMTSREITEPSLPSGVKVVAVGNGTSAAEAGLQAGDVIEAVNGHAVSTMQALQSDLYTMPPHAAIRLTIDRGTSVRTLEARLQAAA
jgi:S1-C subfamily serine protease